MYYFTINNFNDILLIENFVIFGRNGVSNIANDNEKITLNIPVFEILLSLGFISILIGILAPFQLIEFLGFEIWFDPNLSIICLPLGMGLICGYITRKILQSQKGAYCIGLFLGIIGLVIAICVRLSNNSTDNVNSNNKYSDLQKLAELKENGILTEKEFEQQKEKILK